MARRSSRPRLTKEAYAAQRTLAKQLIGYDASSPIWKKTIPEVLDLVEFHIDNGDAADAKDILNEFRKRIAQNRISTTGF